MPTQADSKTIDLQRMINGAVKLELKVLHAGVDYVQVWIAQAARLSNIASETLDAIKNDKASLSETAHRLTEFGKQNSEVFGDLSRRLSKNYYDELGQLAKAIEEKAGKSVKPGNSRKRPMPVKKASRRKPIAAKTILAKA